MRTISRPQLRRFRSHADVRRGDHGAPAEALGSMGWPRSWVDRPAERQACAEGYRVESGHQRRDPLEAVPRPANQRCSERGGGMAATTQLTVDHCRC